MLCPLNSTKRNVFISVYLNLLSLSLVPDASEEVNDDIDDTDSALSLDAFSAFSVVNPNTHPKIYRNIYQYWKYYQFIMKCNYH